MFWEFRIRWWQTCLTVYYLGLLSLSVSVLFVLVHVAPSANMLSSVPCRRQKKFCLLWCFWHPTRGDWRGCESCRRDFHGDRSIRRRYKQHNPSLWSGMCVYMNSSRNSVLVNHIRASSAKERFSQGLFNIVVMAVMIPMLLLSWCTNMRVHSHYLIWAISDWWYRHEVFWKW